MGTRYHGTTEEVRALNAYIKLVRAANSVHAKLGRRLADLGLTENQFGVLEVLLHLGPLNQRALGRKLFTVPGNVTMVVDNLARRGLVERARDRADGRAVSVRLTSRGRLLIARIFPGHVAAIVAAFRALRPAQQEQLGDLCRTVGLGQTNDTPAKPRRATRTAEPAGSVRRGRGARPVRSC